MNRLKKGARKLFCALAFLSLNAPWAAAPTAATHYQLLRTIAREASHFTQGLVFVGNTLFESTGGYGSSALFAYRSSDFVQTAHCALPGDQFGEGITFLHDRLYQLTWKNRTVRVYDLHLRLQTIMSIERDGWGLTTDGHQLITSDGTDTLIFRTPQDARKQRQITAIDRHGKHWHHLNELEWVNGLILANVWYSNNVLVINPKTGLVEQILDFSALAENVRDKKTEQVLNGLAWNPATQTLLLTGKEWPLWFEVKLLLPQTQDRD